MARKQPRISVLKLAEYIGATTLRRRQIVRDPYDPPDQIVPQYRRVRSAVAAFLTRGARDLGVLEAAHQRLGGQEGTTEWAESDRVNSMMALEHFIKVAEQVRWGDGIFERGLRSDAFLLGRVKVSVVPSVILLQEGRGEPLRCIKLALSKNRALDEAEGQTAATLLW